MLKKVQKETTSLPEKVSRELEKLIREHKLKAGDKIPNEFELGEQLNVGRGTVREAIKILVSKNILEIQRGRGTFVSENPGVVDDPLGLSFVEDKEKLKNDLLIVRKMIEPEIAALAAQHADEDDIENLERLCKEVEQLIRKGKDHRRKDMEFHAAIAKASKNIVVPNLVPIIHSGISVFVDETDNSLTEETIETHRQILDAIKHGDSIQARECMRRHLEYNGEYFL